MMKRTKQISSEVAENIVSELVGQPVSHVWFGHGSALFIEFGELTDNPKGNNPIGEQTLMVDWSWRLESLSKILLGSWSDEHVIDKVPIMLNGKAVKGIDFFGRIPELCLSFTNDLWLLTFMTEAGYPDWSIKLKNNEWLSYDNGRYIVETPA